MACHLAGVARATLYARAREHDGTENAEGSEPAAADRRAIHPAAVLLLRLRAGTTSRSPTPANVVACVPLATPGVWSKQRRTWSITSVRRYRCGNGGSKCPKRLRTFLQRDTALQGALLRIFRSVVQRCLREHSPACLAAARLGAVALIHRFGSSRNLHLHFSSGRFA